MKYIYLLLIIISCSKEKNTIQTIQDTTIPTEIVSPSKCESLGFEALWNQIGEGTKENPYLICHPQQFVQLTTLNNHFSSTYFALGRDLSFADLKVDSFESKFSGHIDGRNYTVSDLQIKQRLWPILENASLKNIRFKSFKNLTNSTSNNALIGEMVSSTLENVWIEGHLKGKNRVGGLAISVDSESIIHRCHFKGILEGTQDIAGLVVEFNGLMTDSFSDFKLVLGRRNGSGLIGILKGEVHDSYADVDFEFEKSVQNVSGLIGRAESAHVENSFAISRVNGRIKKNYDDLIGELKNLWHENIYSVQNDQLTSENNIGVKVMARDWFYDEANPPISLWNKNSWMFSPFGLPFHSP